MTFTPDDQAALLPGLIVLLGGFLAVALDVFGLAKHSKWPLVLPSLAGVLGAGWLLVDRLLVPTPAARGFGGSLVLDDVAALLSLAILSAAGLLLVSSDVDVRRRHIGTGEYYGLLLAATASMCWLVSANDLLMTFLTLEVLSVSLYVLTGVTRKNPRSNEAAVKYLVTGAFATGFFLMGIALVYGATGSVTFEGIGASLASGNSSPLLLSGVGMLLVGFGFKIGAAPFHMWVPDVYEGAPTTTTAFMSVTVKAAGIGALGRLLVVALGSRPDLWADLLWWGAVITMVVGNLLAVQQDSVKRMLAYSSVAHTGYALIAFATMQGVGADGAPGAFSGDGLGAALFYVVTYTFMTLGAFVFLVYVGHEAKTAKGGVEWQDGEHIDDLAGLSQRRPWAALAMTIFLISLGGLPPTAGFVGKFNLFVAAVGQGHVALAVIGVLASLVSWYYYLRVVVYMYMKDPVADDEKPAASVGAVVLASALATVALGVFPTVFLTWAERGVERLLG